MNALLVVLANAAVDSIIVQLKRKTPGSIESASAWFVKIHRAMAEADQEAREAIHPMLRRLQAEIDRRMQEQLEEWDKSKKDG